MTLHIFNPDTDYALASDSENYTPPVSILAIKRSLSLLPALYAERGDAILLPDDNPEFLQENHAFIEIISTKDITRYARDTYICLRKNTKMQGSDHGDGTGL